LGPIEKKSHKNLGSHSAPASIHYKFGLFWIFFKFFFASSFLLYIQIFFPDLSTAANFFQLSLCTKYYPL
jgi:hypothetical protein